MLTDGSYVRLTPSSSGSIDGATRRDKTLWSSSQTRLGRGGLAHLGLSVLLVTQLFVAGCSFDRRDTASVLPACVSTCSSLIVRGSPPMRVARNRKPLTTFTEEHTGQRLGNPDRFSSSEQNSSLACTDSIFDFPVDGLPFINPDDLSSSSQGAASNIENSRGTVAVNCYDGIFDNGDGVATRNGTHDIGLINARVVSIADASIRVWPNGGETYHSLSDLLRQDGQATIDTGI
jgi:hypothetical protein